MRDLSSTYLTKTFPEGGWLDEWLENDFLKKTPSPKFGLESQLGTYNFEVCPYFAKKDFGVLKNFLVRQKC